MVPIMPTQVLYHSLSARVVNGLIDNLLFVGVFIVSLAIARRCTRDAGWSQSGDLLRHLLLLFSVTLFTLYVALTYEVESFRGLTPQVPARQAIEMTSGIGQLSQAEQRTAKMQLLVMLPVDLMGITLNSGLFALNALFLLDRKNWTGRNVSTTREVVFLLVVTVAWHVTMVVWWVLYGCFGSGLAGIGQHSLDIAFHACYAACELVLAALIHRVSKTQLGLKHSGGLAWASVAAFCTIYLSLYVVRLWEYSDRFFSLATDGSR
jgi:hypothetical protein